MLHMAELDTDTESTSASPLTQREKRDLQKAQLRPLANRRPELYEEDEYTSEEYEQMIDMYQGTMASIEEGEIVKAKVMEVRDNLVVLDIGLPVKDGFTVLQEMRAAGQRMPVIILSARDDVRDYVATLARSSAFLRTRAFVSPSLADRSRSSRSCSPTAPPTCSTASRWSPSRWRSWPWASGSASRKRTSTTRIPALPDDRGQAASRSRWRARR